MFSVISELNACIWILLLSGIKGLISPRIVHFDENGVNGNVCSCRSECGASRSSRSFLLF
jgi:hypothetical protein